MTPNEYQELALKTESHIEKLQLIGNEVRVLHAAIGIATEAGELLDALKKQFYYLKIRDPVNIMEEFGDLLWYIAIGLDACGSTMEQAMERNIAKLKARYGDKFSSEAALNRDLDTERKTLES